MRKSPNVLFPELEAIQKAHYQLRSGKFFRGSFGRAINEDVVRYPMTCCYYNTGGNNARANQIQLFIIVCDRVYKSYENLDDTESDTWQCVQDYVDIMRGSRRWNKIGRVESAPITKFIDKGADEVTGHMATVTFTLFDSKGVCNLPLVDYDFDNPIDVITIATASGLLVFPSGQDIDLTNYQLIP